MDLIFGTNKAAEILGVHEKTLFAIMREYPDFPRNKLDGFNINTFDKGELLAWSKQYSPEAYKEELSSGKMMLLEDFVGTLGITRTMVNYWIKKGFECKKLLNGKVLIDVAQARKWFKKQNHPKTRAYAEKL